MSMYFGIHGIVVCLSYSSSIFWVTVMVNTNILHCVALYITLHVICHLVKFIYLMGRYNHIKLMIKIMLHKT